MLPHSRRQGSGDSTLSAGTMPARGRVAGLTLAAVLVVTTAGLAGPHDARRDTTWLDVTAESPPSVQLAFQDIKELRVPEVVAERYSRVLDSLSMTCRVGKATMAEVANASVRWLNEHANEEFSRIEFLSSFDESLGTARKSAPDCPAQARSVLLGMADNANLRQMEIETLQKMLHSFYYTAPGGS